MLVSTGKCVSDRKYFFALKFHPLGNRLFLFCRFTVNEVVTIDHSSGGTSKEQLETVLKKRLSRYFTNNKVELF